MEIAIVDEETKKETLKNPAAENELIRPAVANIDLALIILQRQNRSRTLIYWTVSDHDGISGCSCDNLF